MPNKIIIIGGPTASGKSALAVELAHKIDGVIINADSQQVYKEIPIITAQPSVLERGSVQHLLYGMIAVQEFFSVGLWLQLVEDEINKVLKQGKTPILVGGTGLYIKALADGIATVPEISQEIRGHVRRMCDEQGIESVYQLLLEQDQEVALKLKPKDRHRVLRAYEVLLQTGKSLNYWHQQKNTPPFAKKMIQTFFLLPDRNEVYDKCNKRVLQMLENGLLDEMQIIADMNLSHALPAMRAHGLREFVAYLKGEMTLQGATELACQNTRNYVKRQFTWFRHQMPGVIALKDTDGILELM